jgi:hypothetical protein
MSVIPNKSEVLREVIIVLLGSVGAAWIISKVPAWKALVYQNSVPSAEHL